MTYDDVLLIVQKLSLDDKARLLEDISAAVRHEITQSHKPARRSLLGLWEGENISSKDIDAAREEMWGNFPREDI